nr:immunoglobulin light chain junction region [Macaca mulatta]MOX33524.1 immunoglobulin light chain junction region [Macaca mulatta]MOX33580.1 immunoglobulin light chain junction region [Macaca mulatta]MOX33930.1 immunoglobulin light chain junction region [Macaca mulatta]MOX34055.1 immunoglobulin light chain junction region [Macaca mulatta]
DYYCQVWDFTSDHPDVIF